MGAKPQEEWMKMLVDYDALTELAKHGKGASSNNSD